MLGCVGRFWIPFDVAHVSSSLYNGSNPAILTSTNGEDAVAVVVAVGVVVDAAVPGIVVDVTVADDVIGGVVIGIAVAVVFAIGVVVDDVVVTAVEVVNDNKAVLISCNNKSRKTFSYPSKTPISDHGCACVFKGPNVTINATEHILSVE